MPPSRFALHSFLCSWLLTSTCSGLWSGVRPGYTRAPADLCTYWFRWLPTNYFWSAANFSRLMLCGWQMSATINRLMLPAFPEPTTNPSIWVTVGSTGRQRHVCAGTLVFLLSFSPWFPHPESQSCSSSCQNPPAQHSTAHVGKKNKELLVLSYAIYVIFQIY